MIVDASSPLRSGLLQQAALSFGRAAPQGEAFVEAPATLAFVAVGSSNQVIGWCWGYHLVRPDAPSMVYLHDIEVSEEHRRQGHGRALLEAFMAAGRRAGASKLFLNTAEANRPARRLYDSMGGGLAAQGPTVNYWFQLR